MECRYWIFDRVDFRLAPNRPTPRRKRRAGRLTPDERWAFGYRGAPILACNHWLEAQMRQLPDPRQYHHLFDAWLARYVVLRGVAPAAPRRSFRAAAQGCLQRILTPGGRREP